MVACQEPLIPAVFTAMPRGRSRDRSRQQVRAGFAAELQPFRQRLLISGLGKGRSGSFRPDAPAREPRSHRLRRSGQGDTADGLLPAPLSGEYTSFGPPCASSGLTCWRAPRG
jgi:hypothetical protein